MAMAKKGHSTARRSPPRSSAASSSPPSPTEKRNRKGCPINLKQHECYAIQSNLLWREKQKKATHIFIDGEKYNLQDINRRIRRATKAQVEAKETPLPSRIQLRTPPPERASLAGPETANTENIDAYRKSTSLDHRLPGTATRPWPYPEIPFISLLQAATLRGEVQKIRQLLGEGADVNCPAHGPGGVTPLQAACLLELKSPRHDENKREIVNLLLKRGAEVNAAPAWKFGLTALQAAALVGDLPLVKLLVSRGADVNAPACKYGGGTALANAATGECWFSMVLFLVKGGAVVPPGGVRVSSSGVTYKDNEELILDLHGVCPQELGAEIGGYRIPSRDYLEYYEAEWAKDPTYEGRGPESARRV
ncbi:ankyrin repeat-containing domain protein [Diaporthe sp. PMI_573]|nr:ankyrin repeat-containing domain protein [Diaporthaceae sp. PMI_573]